jgi:hypothetical protein
MKLRYLSIFAAMTFGSVVALSQTGDGFFQVRYASNLPVGDSVINATNTGASSTIPFPTQNGNICMNVYTFSPDEQLISCCACPITPDGLVSLSARNDLISNTLTPGVPTSIVIKLVGSAQATACNASTVGQGANVLVPGLAAWATTIHALPVTPGSPATTYGTTESPFTSASLGGIRAVTIVAGSAIIVTSTTGLQVGQTISGTGIPAGTIVVGLTPVSVTMSASATETGANIPLTFGTAGSAELTRITTLCGFIQTNGSGFGICRSCRFGGLAATEQ